MVLSIIIPVFNNEKTIGSCIESCIQQTNGIKGDIEIIVVDDCSTDATFDICCNVASKRSSPNLNIFIKKLSSNLGPSIARNIGLQSSGGMYIAFLDSDDEAMNGRFVRQIEYLENNESIGIHISALAEFTENDIFIRNRIRPIPSEKNEIVKELFIGRISSFMPTIMMRREIFDKIGGFNEKLRMFEDKEYMLRVLRYYNLFYDVTPLVKRRITESDLPASVDTVMYISTWDYCYDTSVKLFPFLTREKRHYYGINYFILGRTLQRIGESRKAIKYYLRSRTLKSYLGIMSVLLLPRSLQIQVAGRIWRKR